jgi:microcystin-dependent protein
MGQPYVGEIRMFGGNFAPAGWMFCEGQLLAISEYDTLFNLIGTTYGGDGQQTFGLPDLRGRLPIHQGNNGVSNYVIGQLGGVENVTLSTNQIPAHTHAVTASSSPSSTSIPNGNYLASGPDIYDQGKPGTAVMASAISFVGGTQPHSNFQPYLCVYFIISLFGIYPSQT